MEFNRVFLYFLFREIKLKQRWKPILVGQILTPVMYFMFLGVAFSYNMQTFMFRGYSINYLAFLLPGIIAIQTFASFSLTSTIVSNERRYGIFRLFMISKGNTMDYIGAKISTEVLIVLLQTFALIIVTTIVSPNITGTIKWKTIPSIVLVVIISTVFWCNLGCILGLVLYREEKRTLFFSILNLPILFCSSIFYDIGKLPGWMNKIALINPLTYCAEALREVILTGKLFVFAFFVLLIITIFVGILTQFIASRVSLIPEA